jgi:hypothetical protein
VERYYDGGALEAAEAADDEEARPVAC